MRKTDDSNRLACRSSQNGIHLTINNWVVSLIPVCLDGYESSVQVKIWDLEGTELDATGYGAFTVDTAQTLEQVLSTVRLYGLHANARDLIGGMLRSCIGMTADEYEAHKTGTINVCQACGEAPCEPNHEYCGACIEVLTERSDAEEQARADGMDECGCCPKLDPQTIEDAGFGSIKPNAEHMLNPFDTPCVCGTSPCSCLEF